MSQLKDNYNYYYERIRMGSVSIRREDMPFSSFLIGYYIGRTNCSIDQLFQLLEILEELSCERMISTLMKRQILTLLQDFPKDLKNMIRTLEDYHKGKNIDLIRWIESYYSNCKPKPSSPVAAVPINAAQLDGTIQLQNDSYTEELEEKKKNQEKDIELARKMQEEFDKERNQKDEDDVPCEICYCNLYDDAFECLEVCNHFFHINCMAQAFKTNIMSNNFPINCPNEECKKQVTQGDLKRILDKPMFQKYQNHTLKAYADGHGDSISWCPTANCNYMFFFMKGDNERFQCEQCKKEYCLNCRVEWHKEMTCKEYKVSSTMSQEDQKFLEFAKGKKFKQCPKCKFWVQKNEGCDHMTCKCKFQFCYKCGGVYMKCECVENMRQQQERRRQMLQERRRRKQERKKALASKTASRVTRKEEQERRQEQLKRQREERDGRANRTSRRKK